VPPSRYYGVISSMAVSSQLPQFSTSRYIGKRLGDEGGLILAAGSPQLLNRAQTHMEADETLLIRQLLKNILLLFGLGGANR
jgi:hypothetical protein